MKLRSVRVITAFVVVAILSACNTDAESEKQKTNSDAVNNAAFTAVNGIRFYEVKRRFRNGLSFNNEGFQQEPTWIIEFKAPDTMLAYSPEKKGMESFYLHHDHGEVYNFAREFFRAKTISKDSLVLQRLQVNGRIIAGDDDIRSDVYCTYYSKDFIENKLKTTVEALRRPTSADTLFIKQLSAKTQGHPNNPAFAFAARQPVRFIPQSKFISVEKQSSVDLMNNRTAAYDYMYPQYKIVIQRAYKTFAYGLQVLVDPNGNLYVMKVEGVQADAMESKKRMMQGVVDVYLKNMLKIIPGTTLGIPHSSAIVINIVAKEI